MVLLSSFPISTCASYFSVAVPKQHDKRQLKEEFILAYGSKGIRVCYVGEGWQPALGMGMGRREIMSTATMKQKDRVNQKHSEAKKILKTATAHDIFL